MTGGAEHVIEPEIDMGGHVAVEDNRHVIMSEREGVSRGAKRAEDGVEKEEPHNHHEHTEKEVEHDHVAQDLIRREEVFLS